jgi:hypothetical protein
VGTTVNKTPCSGLVAASCCASSWRRPKAAPPVIDNSYVRGRPPFKKKKTPTLMAAITNKGTAKRNQWRGIMRVFPGPMANDRWTGGASDNPKKPGLTSQGPGARPGFFRPN